MKVKKILASCVTMILIVAMVATGFVFAAPSRQQSTNGNINYAPDSGIRWNPGAGYFEVYNYAGFTHIGSEKFISTTGDTTAAAEVAGSIKQATMADTYNLMQDIYFEESDSSVARSQAEFTGILDGRGMQLINFPMQKIGSNEQYFGLFAKNSGTIKNLTMLDPNFDAVSQGSVGILVHTNLSGKISNCVLDGSVTKSGDVNFGGFVYQVQLNKSVEIVDCKNNLDITTNGNIGGIVGVMESNSNFHGTVTMKNTVNNGDLSGNAANGLLGGVTIVTGFSAYNCVNTGKLTGKVVSYDFSYKNSGKLDNCYGANGTLQTPSGLPYVLKMVTNGGTFTIQNATSVGSDYMMDQWTGESVKLPTSGTKANHTFSGWYTTPDFKAGSQVDTVNSQYMANGMVSVYAKWTNVNADGYLLYTYNTERDEYSVKLNEDFYGDIVIPASHKGKLVTEIDRDGFKNSSITSVYIPDTVNNLGEDAFEGCTNLKSVRLPETEMPVIYRGTSKINYNGYGCFISTGLESLTIPNQWKEIPIAFARFASQLKTVKLSDNTEIIGGNALEGTGIEEIVIPSKVKQIGVYAIGSCQELKSVNIPKSVQTIDSKAFDGTIAQFNVDPDNTAYESKDGGLIDKSTKTLMKGYMTIPDGIEIIANNAFGGREDLTSMIIPSSIKKIGNQVFYGTGISSLNIPSTVEELGNQILLGMRNLKTVTVDEAHAIYRSEDNCIITKDGNVLLAAAPIITAIPNSVVALGDDSMYGLLAKTITIHENITTIGRNVFWRANLETITVPSTVSEIGVQVFTGCVNLKSVKWEASIIPIQAVYGCVNLTDFTISDNVKEIGASAFFGCSSISKLFIPASVTKIDAKAFVNCPNLIIYCEAQSKPADWIVNPTNPVYNWNFDNNIVYWGQTRPTI